MRRWISIYLFAAGCYLASPALPSHVSGWIIGAILASGLALMYEPSGPGERLAEVGEAAVRSAAVLSALLVAGYLGGRLLARMHTMPAAAGWLVSGIVKASGVASSCPPGSSAILVEDGLSWGLYADSPEVFQLAFALLMAASSVSHLLCVKTSAGRIAAVLGVICGWTVLRTALIVTVSIDLGNSMPLWSKIWTVVTYSPLVPLLYLVAGAPGWEPTRVPRPASHYAAILLALILGFATTFTFPSSEKRAHVLMDDSHSDWEWSTEMYDTETFGRRSNYNYNFLVQLLEQAYEVNVNSSEALTSDLLADFDVLIIKTPTKDFGGGEIAAITQWVKEGGGLLVLGDHTNLFGLSERLNDVIAPYGMSFGYDATYDLRTGALSVWHRPLMSGPVTREVSTMRFATSCTITAPLVADDLITGQSLGCEALDYSNPGFFGNMTLDTSDSYGTFLQAVAVNSGHGRVLAFSDSTVFSNFDVCMPGKRELLFGMVSYLNRRGLGTWPRQVIWAATLVGLVALPIWSQLGKRRLAIVIIGLFLAVGAELGFVVDRAVTPAREMARPLPSIGFVLKDAAAWLPSVLDTELDDPGLAFDTFYVWAERVHAVPQVVTLEDIPQECSGLVILNPTRAPTEAEARVVSEFVEEGGRLLIADRSSGGPGTRLNDWLAALGTTMRVHHLGTVDDALMVSGGEPFAGDQRLSLCRVGKGQVAVLGKSEVYSREYLGHMDDIPDQRRLAAFDKAFAVLEWLAAPRASTPISQTQEGPRT